MKFHFDDKNEHNSKEILQEFIDQYADNFQHLGMNYWNETILPNIDLLLMVLHEWKDDSELEYWNVNYPRLKPRAF